MSANSSLLLMALAFLLQAAPVLAVDNHLGAHFRDPSEFRQIIDTRCLNCHDRDRIEAARQRQEALEPLQRRMVEHGAVLNERDRQVLGTFWGMPLKEDDRK